MRVTPKTSISARLRLKTYMTNVKLLLKTAPKFLLPLLTIDGAWRAYPTYMQLFNEFSTNLYYMQIMSPPVQKAAALDVTIVDIEGVGITATIFITEVTLFIFFSVGFTIWLAQKNCRTPAAAKADAENETRAVANAKEKIKAAQTRAQTAGAVLTAAHSASNIHKANEAIDNAAYAAIMAEAAAQSAETHHRVNCATDSDTVKTAAAARAMSSKAKAVTAEIRAKATEASTLVELRELARQAATAAIEASEAAELAELAHEIHSNDELNDNLNRDSPLIKKIKAINRYSNGLAKYSMIASTIGLGVGLYLMHRQTSLIQSSLDCPDYPLWALLADNCSTDSLLQLLSMTSYLWASISIAGFTSYTSLMLLGLTAYSLNLTQLKNLANRIDAPFENLLNGNNRERWLYQDLCFQRLLPSLLAVVIFAVKRAMDFSDRFATENYCASFWQVLVSLFSEHYDDTVFCDSSRIAISLSGFLGNFEIGKIWGIYSAYKLMTFTLGSIIACIPHFQKEKTRDRARNYLGKLKKETNASSTWLIAGVISGGVIAYPTAQMLGNHITSNGFFIWESLLGIIFRFRITEPCGHTLNNAYFNVLIGKTPAGCDPILEGRGFSGFIATYWMTVLLGASLGVAAFAVRSNAPKIKNSISNAYSQFRVWASKNCCVLSGEGRPLLGLVNS